MPALEHPGRVDRAELPEHPLDVTQNLPIKGVVVVD